MLFSLMEDHKLFYLLELLTVKYTFSYAWRASQGCAFHCRIEDGSNLGLLVPILYLLTQALVWLSRQLLQILLKNETAIFGGRFLLLVILHQTVCLNLCLLPVSRRPTHFPPLNGGWRSGALSPSGGSPAPAPAPEAPIWQLTTAPDTSIWRFFANLYSVFLKRIHNLCPHKDPSPSCLSMSW